MNQARFLTHDWFPRALPDNVELGEQSWLYSTFAFLHYQSKQPCGVRVGHDSGLYNGTFFDLGPEGEVEIGNYCTLVGAIIVTNQRVKIADYAFIAHEVVIADSWIARPYHEDLRPEESSHDGKRPGVEIGSNAWIGAGATLLAGARIGEGAIVGAATVVDFEVPEYAVVAGNPAKIKAWTHSKRVL